MTPRDRILDAAITVFRRHGFRRSSIEQAAEAAGLTRQALYHHFKSKEALFRAVLERLHENALAAGIAAANAKEQDGGSLADVLIAQITARFSLLIASLEGSPHIEELFSEHLVHARDLYQKYAGRYAEQGVATIENIRRKQKLVLAISSTELARCVEMAINGSKSIHKDMQPPEAFFRDVEIMLRTLLAGAIAASPKPRRAKPKLAKKSSAKTPSSGKRSGDRK
jgi:AcrR family transcriptional regulator